MKLRIKSNGHVFDVAARGLGLALLETGVVEEVKEPAQTRVPAEWFNLVFSDNNEPYIKSVCKKCPHTNFMNPTKMPTYFHCGATDTCSQEVYQTYLKQRAAWNQGIATEQADREAAAGDGGVWAARNLIDGVGPRVVRVGGGHQN
jgi:hypothetical protein